MDETGILSSQLILLQIGLHFDGMQSLTGFNQWQVRIVVCPIVDASTVGDYAKPLVDGHAPQRPDPTAHGPDPRPALCPYRSWQQRCQSVNGSSACSVSEVSMREGFLRGTLTNSRPPWPAIPPRSGQIRRFFPGLPHITQTREGRIPKTKRFQQVENSRVRQTRATPV